MTPRLGVNIDHIATVREARQTNYPDPIESVPILKKCGVTQITCHLREDRRHIQDHDLERLLALKALPINLEMALTDEMIGIARKSLAATCTLVPEKRQEVTTEGGLNLKTNYGELEKKIPLLHEKGIRVSLFIDPDIEQVELAHQLKVDGIELHTGSYCEAYGQAMEDLEFQRLADSTRYATDRNLKVFAGHGLNTVNLARVVTIREIEEYNIGHSIIARAVFVGLERAVMEIQKILCSS